jgi:hypothetical protein
MAATEEPKQPIPNLLEEARRVLELPEMVSFQEIQDAYHEQSLRWHPDRHDESQREVSTRRMQNINKAYKVLREYFFRYPISLRREDLKEPWDPETWWKNRFGSAFWQKDDDST